MKRYDVAVIGAGPYGLSVTAHLKAKGLNAAVFGQPMSFWYEHMPVGMLLRLPSWASDVSDPAGDFSLKKYREGSGYAESAIVPLDQFVEYGLWFQQRVIPDVDQRGVCRVSKNGKFSLMLQDGEEIAASRVVVAAGISTFANRPPQFAGLPPTLVSHSSEHRDLSTFKDRSVVVIGVGQSGLESAALLHEAGAAVEVLARSPIRWLREKDESILFTMFERMLWGPAGGGPAGVSKIVEYPNCYRMIPRSLQDRFGKHKPAGASWLRPRLVNVPIRTGCTVVEAIRIGEKIQLRLNDGTQRTVDHVLLATGYRVDISRYDFLASQILSAVERTNGFPKLNSVFESSVEGLHFVGAPAQWSFGPLLRFVAGAGFAARAVARGAAGTRTNAREPEPALARAS